VGVDDETDRLVGNSLERRLNPVGQRCVLIINYDYAIFTDGCSDVSACSFQHVNGTGDFGDFDLYFAEVLLLGCRQRATEQQCHNKQQCFAHSRPPRAQRF
jgi:hypothetical protein